MAAPDRPPKVHSTLQVASRAAPCRLEAVGADRRSGKVLAETLWESEEAMLQSEGAADQLRSDST